MRSTSFDDALKGTNRGGIEKEERHSIFTDTFLTYKKDAKEEVGQSKRDGMTEKHIRAYSTCHFYNDMNSCVYQVYKLVYLVQVINLDLGIIGTAYLIG